MEILQVVPLNSKSEMPVFVVNQLQSLVPHGINSQVVGFRGSQITVKKPIKSLWSVVVLYRVIQNSDAKVIHAHWGSLLGAICGFSKRSDQTLILTLRGSDVNRVLSEHKLVFYIRTLLSRFAVSKSSHVIYVSEQLNRGWKKEESDFSVIPDGTSTDIFFPRNKDKSRHQLNWKNDTYYVLFYCGERPREKNLSLALEVLDIVKRTLKNVKLIIIESDLTQDELAIHFCAADALLFTSHAEGSPNVVREAIASGCPVVSVDVGDTSRWVHMSKAGHLASYDPIELSQGVIDTIKNPVLPNYSIAQLYSVDYSAQILAKVYFRFGI
jgi:glycosyltransferase involved in cell wall biosynthesis